MEEIGEGAGLRGRELSSGRGLVCMYASWEGNIPGLLEGRNIRDSAAKSEFLSKAISAKAIWTAASPHC